MAENIPWQPQVGDKRRVVVVGGGIAGLTAAHELAERGFEVEVIEAAGDPYHGKTPLLGGMARTTWATVPEPPDQFPLSTPRSPLFTPLAADRVMPLIIPFDDHIYKDDGPHFQDSIDAYFEAWAPPTRFAVIVVGMLDKPQLERLEAALEGVIPGRWNATYVGGDRRPSIQFSLQSARVAGEHGFRFFPSFYRNMFDTMKRIPIEEASIAPSTTTVPATSDSIRTAFDALESADEIGLGLNSSRGRNRSYNITRHPIRSFQQLRELVQNALERAGYRGQDLYRLVTRYVEYATSCDARRQHEYEGLSWSEFLGLDQNYSRYFASHVSGGAQGLAAMSSQSNDTRTIGTIALQLTLDELRVNSSGYSDATLRGPTSVSLFGPWQEYLKTLSVKFTLGTLVGFTGHGMAVRPAFEFPGLNGQIHDPADYYVIAIPIHCFKVLFDDAGNSTRSGLLSRQELLCANSACLELDLLEAEATGRPITLPSAERDDLRKHLDYPIHDYSAHPDTGPLRYMCGIQFYFDADVRLFLGHTLCLDSPWGVSYLSQEQYWQDRTRGQDGVRGVLSAIFTRWEVEAPGLADPTPKTALACSDAQIAERVWKQIADSWNSDNGVLPQPRYFFLDQNLSYDERTKKWSNDTPYLVNAVDDWDRRGGGRHPDGSYEYPIQLGHIVFAGTFMRTSTRLNSMEAANESGRRAANAILARENLEGERVPVYEVERYELPELRPLRELDRRIFERGGRHTLRSTLAEVGLRAIPWDLVRLGLPTIGEEP